MSDQRIPLTGVYCHTVGGVYRRLNVLPKRYEIHAWRVDSSLRSAPAVAVRPA